MPRRKASRLRSFVSIMRRSSGPWNARWAGRLRSCVDRQHESGDEKNLRRLEMDLLPAGVEVSRTAADLLRHHYKFMIVDRECCTC